MNLLMLILSAVMTWTVETKSSVSGDGTYPASMSVTYSCSYQKGTVRKDDVAMISFSNMGGMTIEQIEVYVRSNKSAGSGTFTVEANESTIATKSGSLKDWTGSYDNVNYYPVPLLQEAVNNVNTLSVSLTGTVNSLHIEKYLIRYTPVSPRSVTLMKGNTEYITLTHGRNSISMLSLPCRTLGSFPVNIIQLRMKRFGRSIPMKRPSNRHSFPPLRVVIISMLILQK